jgi:hypothetical protein
MACANLWPDGSAMSKRLLVTACLAAIALLHPIDGVAQPSARHVTVPFLANATKPANLDFQGGECDVDADGNAMTCQFEQVILTLSDVAPQTCFITTNHYDRVFQKQSATGWINRQGAEGACGIAEVTTLQDDGGVRWTMEIRKIATAKDAAPACRAVAEPPEVLSWQNVRRPLPCTFIQPGSLSR